jgi:hypothetical protein
MGSILFLKISDGFSESNASYLSFNFLSLGKYYSLSSSLEQIPSRDSEELYASEISSFSV